MFVCYPSVKPHILCARREETNGCHQAWSLRAIGVLSMLCSKPCARDVGAHNTWNIEVNVDPTKFGRETSKQEIGRHMKQLAKECALVENIGMRRMKGFLESEPRGGLCP